MNIYNCSDFLFPFLIGNTPDHSWFIFNLRLPEWRVESSLPSIFMMLCIFVGFFLPIFYIFFFSFNSSLGGGFKKNTPKIGEMIQFDQHTFQMGWFNHQLDQLGSNLFTPLRGRVRPHQAYKVSSKNTVFCAIFVLVKEKTLVFTTFWQRQGRKSSKNIAIYSVF